MIDMFWFCKLIERYGASRGESLSPARSRIYDPARSATNCSTRRCTLAMQEPHTVPAPVLSWTSSRVAAPLSTASLIMPLVTLWQKQITSSRFICQHLPFGDSMCRAEKNYVSFRVSAFPRRLTTEQKGKIWQLLNKF